MVNFRFSRSKALNSEQFKEIFEEYYPSLYHYALRLITDEEAADDIVQDAFLHLWKVRNKSNLHFIKGYLYTSVRNNCMNYLRHEKVKAYYAGNLQQEQFIHTLSFLEEEVGRELMKSVNKLPEQRKTVLLLHIEGYSQEEIAQKLGISVNTVKTHKLRARKFLRNEFKNLDKGLI